MKTIFERLKEERLNFGLSQSQFGEIGGVKKGAQIKYESGERCPDGNYYARIAAAGADVQYILTGVRSGTSPGAAALSVREEKLLDNYRHIADEEDKAAVERTALMAARPAREETKPQRLNNEERRHENRRKAG